MYGVGSYPKDQGFKLMILDASAAYASSRECAKIANFHRRPAASVKRSPTSRPPLFSSDLACNQPHKRRAAAELPTGADRSGWKSTKFRLRLPQWKIGRHLFGNGWHFGVTP